ncbi:MAG TPA: hypothetical protein PKD16_15725 [Saprospiraceae bacterium]|nr:hypothetical protein [Saprospiraceae bacterium]
MTKYKIIVKGLCFVLLPVFQCVRCNSIKSFQNDIQVNLDSLYMIALKVAFKGSCFYTPISPTINNTSVETDSVLAESYLYFNKRFENFIVDSTIKFDIENLGPKSKTLDSIIQVDSISLKNFGNISFNKASKKENEMSLNLLALSSIDKLLHNHSFNGFISFSKPIFRRKNDQTFEIFIRISKMIDSPRHCYIRLLVVGNEIVESEILSYTENLIFR